MIEDGLLLIEDAKVAPSYRVRGGELVEAQLPEEGLSPEEIEVPVVFEDGDIIVVDKPAELVVHPGAGNPSGTLVNALLGRGIAGGEDAQRPGVVHRLDRDTSGAHGAGEGGACVLAARGDDGRPEGRRVYRAVP
jgi:23S rRNA pseudouridine1911/1915/1917 synthase